MKKLIILIVLSILIGCSIKEGTVVDKQYEPLDIYLIQKTISVTRPVPTTSITIVNGVARTTTSITQVFDHFDYAVYRVIDFEDWTVKIRDIKRNKVKESLVYVTKPVYNMVREGRHFRVNRKRGDRMSDKNNEYHQVLRRSHHPYDMSRLSVDTHGKVTIE